jgi:hypothetical protein
MYAQEHGNRAASRKYGINERNVRKWRKTEEELNTMPTLKMAERHTLLKKKRTLNKVKLFPKLENQCNEIVYPAFSINSSRSLNRRSYTALEKLSVAEYAQEHGNRAAERMYGVNEMNVRRWRKNMDLLKSMPSLKKADRGSVCKYPEMETSLVAWITDCRERGDSIGTRDIRLAASEIARKDPNMSTFKASNGWATNFMRRNGIKTTRKRSKSLKEIVKF